MLRSIKQLYEDILGASDGDIGQVRDFYFDDQNWTIRYLVADTGLWLPGRHVLISPHSLGHFDQAGKLLGVNLTRKQIENSPSFESHKPVSRQYEEEYHRYYGWPYYWQGGGLWGRSGFPLLKLPAKPLAKEPARASDPQHPTANIQTVANIRAYLAAIPDEQLCPTGRQTRRPRPSPPRSDATP